MKKKLLSLPISLQYLINFLQKDNLNPRKILFNKLHLSLLISLICSSLIGQQTKTFTSNGTVVVPAGLTTMNVQAWGGGAAGGSAIATTLVGRSGGGGGGGAYARSNITVTAPATLSVVVGAGGTATTTNGGAGGNSTITGFQTSILAAGGTGGRANTGGTATGGLGAGGSLTTSVGNVTKIAGGDGTNGSSALLGLLFYTGAGGNGSGTGGGTGGAAISSLVLGSSVGNPGAIIGGGGGGGMSSSTTTTELGGAGARGQVIVTYTCPTYNLTNTTATNTCFASANSTITLTSSAAGLPVGNYTVTYNRAIPAATGLTILMPVTTAGTGTFTIGGLVTAGTSGITITALTSGACVSNISTGNTANITVSPASVGGTVGGGTPICNGATSGTLTLTGNIGTVTSWQADTGPFSGWEDIADTSGLTSYTSGALTTTTSYRAVVQSGTCVPVNSVATTVTVNPLPQGSLTANGPFCATGSGQLTFTATAGTGPYTIVYKENGGADRTASGVVSGTPFATFTPTVTGSTTYTLVSVTGSLNCVRNTGFTGGSATITVNPLPQGSLTANGPFCETGSAQLTFTATEGTGPYTIVYKENGGADQTANGVVSGAPFTPFTPTVTGSTTYTLVSVTGSNNCVRSNGFTGGSSTITVNPLPQGSLTANGPFCESGSGQLTFTATAGTGPYTIVYKENGGADQTVNGVVSGAPFAPFTPTVTGLTTYTLVSVTGSNNCVRNTGFTGGASTIIVNPLPQGSLTTNGPFCETGSGQLTFTATEGTGPYTIVYKENGGADQTANGVVSGSPFAPFTSTVTGSTTYTLVSVMGSDTCVRTSGFSDGTAIIIINPLPNITLGTAETVCMSSSIQSALLNFTSPTESPTTYSIVWSATPSNSFVEVIDDALTGSSISISVPAGTAVGTYTGTLKVKNNNSCMSSAGISFSVIVKALPATPTWGAVTQSSCVSPTGSVTLSGLTASTPWTIIQTGTFPNSYAGSGTTYQVTNLAPGTYYFAVQYGTDCSSIPTPMVTINTAVTNTWNGTLWSKGSPPIATDAIVFAGNYSTVGNLSGCSCDINSGVTVTVNSNHTLSILNSVNNNGGTLIFENNSSLLQDSDAINTGDIIYKRTTPPVRKYDLTYWSSPVTRIPAFTLHDLSPGTMFDKFYKYDVTTDTWIIIYNGTDEMRKGVGYNVRTQQDYDIYTAKPFSTTFTGVANNGPVSVPLGGLDTWVLVGNPYPSAVYADQFIFDNQANLYGTLYFWTHNSPPSSSYPGDGKYNYNDADFAIYNLTGSSTVGGMTGTGATTPGNQNPPLGYIAAGQAFFAQSKTNGNAVFTNSMRVVGSNTQFYKTSGTEVTVEKHRVWINMTNTQGAFKQLLIGYVTGATNSWDNNYDGLSLDGNKYIDFYSIDDDRKLVIQGRAVPFNETDIIPIGYRSALEGNFTIAIDHSDGELSTRAIYLEDKTTGLTQDLTVKDYTFSTIIGTFNDRFTITYGKTLGVEDFEKENDILVSVKNKIIKLASNSNNENLDEVTIYDVSGKVLYNKKKIDSNELEIANLKSGDQVLIVKSTLQNGHTTKTKIVF